MSNELPTFDLVLGLTKGNIQKAYSNKDLDIIGPVLKDTLLDGSELVIFHKPNTLISDAYMPIVEGEKLSFFVNEQFLGNQFHRTKLEDIACINFEFDNGAFGTLQATINQPKAFNIRQIVGQKGICIRPFYEQQPNFLETNLLLMRITG